MCLKLLEVLLTAIMACLQPPPTTPALLEGKEKRHRFVVQAGRVKEDSQEFLAFRQHYVLSWGR